MLAARRSQLISRVLAAALSDCSASRPSLPQAAATQIGALAGPEPQHSAATTWSHGLQRPYSQAAPSSEAGPHHQAPHDQAAAAAAAGAGEFEGGHEQPDGSYQYEDSYKYGSYEAEDDHQVEDLQHELLEASLAHVAQLGWTQAALQAGAHDVGVSPSSAGILDQGAVQLVEFFMNRCNRELEQALQQPAPAAAVGEGAGEEAAGAGAGAGSIAEHVRRGLRLRLEMNVPHINSWAQALSLQARPQAAARALQQRAEIADIIWHAAGDRSIDLTWYIKRGLLTGIYSATELYMLTDASPGFADTWAALDRQLAGWLRGRV